MLGILNINYIEKQSPFKILKNYLFPKIKKNEITFNNKVIYNYSLSLMPFNFRTREKYLRLLTKMLMSDGITTVAGAPPAWSKELYNFGIRVCDTHRYLTYNICNLLHTLKDKVLPLDAHICICEGRPDSITKILAKYALSFYSLVTIVTADEEYYSEFSEELLAESGSPLIVTSSTESLKNGTLIVCLSDFESFISGIRALSRKIVISLDENFIPSGFLPQNIINAFSPALPDVLLNLRPKGVPLHEFAAALFFEDIVTDDNITQFFSFGRDVSLQSLKP